MVNPTALSVGDWQFIALPRAFLSGAFLSWRCLRQPVGA
jgi:hypothetical protein